MAKEDEKVDVVEFTDSPQHGGTQFIEGTVIGFKDKGVAEYLIKCGWAKPSSAKPKFTYEEGSFEVDPDTIHHESGLLVADLKVKSEG